MVYGPEGCGKTTLFREAVSRFDGWFSDGRAVYVNALAEGLDKALAVTGGAPAEIVNDVTAALSRLLPGTASKAAGTAGRLSARATAVDRLPARLGPHRVTAVVDEAVPRSPHRYIKHLEGDANRPEERQGKIVRLLVLTSRAGRGIGSWTHPVRMSRTCPVQTFEVKGLSSTGPQGRPPSTRRSGPAAGTPAASGTRRSWASTWNVWKL